MRYFRGHAALAAQLGVPEDAQPFWKLLAVEAPVWFGMVLLVPAILRIADAFPVSGPRRWPHLGVHLAFFPLATLAGAVLSTLGRWPLLGVQPGGFLLHVEVYFIILVSFYPRNYVLILLGHHLLVHARHLRQRELDEARLEALLARARLQALQSQMQPHFLFNSLTGIAALIGEDDERAHRLVVDMSTLLRAICDADDDEIRLGDELVLLDTYVALQQARFGDRLRYSRQVPEEALDLLCRASPCSLWSRTWSSTASSAGWRRSKCASRRVSRRGVWCSSSPTTGRGPPPGAPSGSASATCASVCACSTATHRRCASSAAPRAEPR